MDQDQLIREEFVNYKKTHSETLMPMVDNCSRGCDKSTADLTALAVTIGPGSFTGLRIGLATIKGLSLAAALPVVGISTLDVLAHNLAFSDSLVCPLLNARKQEVYTAIYDNRGFYPRRLSEEMACSPQELAERSGLLLKIAAGKGLFCWGTGTFPIAIFLENTWGIYC